FGEQAEERVRIGRGEFAAFHLRGFHGLEFQFRARDEAGETVTAECRPEKFAVDVRRADEISNRSRDFHLKHEVFDGSGAMMILAVHVARQGPAQTYEHGSRRDRQKKTAWKSDGENLAQSDARFGIEHA